MQKNIKPVNRRGAGTNVVGACLAEHGGIILNFSKMNKILELNRQNMTARVQPGVIVGELQKQAENVGLYYPPDPSNLAVSTIGGSIAQSSGGARTFKYGSTKDYIIDMKVVMADGEILQTGSNTIKSDRLQSRKPFYRKRRHAWHCCRSDCQTYSKTRNTSCFDGIF